MTASMLEEQMVVMTAALKVKYLVHLMVDTKAEPKANKTVY